MIGYGLVHACRGPYNSMADPTIQSQGGIGIEWLGPEPAQRDIELPAEMMLTLKNKHRGGRELTIVDPVPAPVEV